MYSSWSIELAYNMYLEQYLMAGHGGSVGCASDGLRFQPRLGRQHSFVETDLEIFSRAIPLPSVDSRRAVVSFSRKSAHNTG